MKPLQNLLGFLNPPFLRKADHYLLRNYPMLWVYRAHYVAFYAVVTSLVLGVYTYFGVTKLYQIQQLQTIYYTLLAIAVVFVLYIAYFVRRYTARNLYFNRVGSNHYVNYICLLGFFILLIFPNIFVFNVFVSNMNYDYSKGKESINDFDFFLFNHKYHQYEGVEREKSIGNKNLYYEGSIICKTDFELYIEEKLSIFKIQKNITTQAKRMIGDYNENEYKELRLFANSVYENISEIINKLIKENSQTNNKIWILDANDMHDIEILKKTKKHRIDSLDKHFKYKEKIRLYLIQKYVKIDKQSDIDNYYNAKEMFDNIELFSFFNDENSIIIYLLLPFLALFYIFNLSVSMYYITFDKTLIVFIFSIIFIIFPFLIYYAIGRTESLESVALIYIILLLFLFVFNIMKEFFSNTNRNRFYILYRIFSILYPYVFFWFTVGILNITFNTLKYNHILFGTISSCFFFAITYARLHHVESLPHEK